MGSTESSISISYAERPNPHSSHVGWGLRKHFIWVLWKAIDPVVALCHHFDMHFSGSYAPFCSASAVVLNFGIERDGFVWELANLIFGAANPRRSASTCRTVCSPAPTR